MLSLYIYQYLVFAMQASPLVYTLNPLSDGKPSVVANKTYDFG